MLMRNPNTAAPDGSLLRSYPLLDSAIDGAGAAYAAIRRRLQRWRCQKTLAALDDRQLDDIGLTRADIASWGGRLSSAAGRPNASDRQRRALASLPDDRLCDLSESGRRIRRQARQEFHRA